MSYILALVFGWGPYYDIGVNSNNYSSHRCILPIDYILYLIYGPIWIPTNPDVTADPIAFDLIESPTGNVRPYSWRRARDRLGLMLRHTFECIIFFGIAFIKYYFEMTSHFEYVLPLISTITMAVVTGLIYAYNVTLEKEASSTSYWRFEEPTGKSEVETGILLHLLIGICILF